MVYNKKEEKNDDDMKSIKNQSTCSFDICAGVVVAQKKTRKEKNAILHVLNKNFVTLWNLMCQKRDYTYYCVYCCDLQLFFFLCVCVKLVMMREKKEPFLC